MTVSANSTVDTVRGLVAQQLKFPTGYALGLDDDLWKLGMTSMASMGLMVKIEETFAVEIPLELLNESSFRTLKSLVRAVEESIKLRKRIDVSQLE